MTVGGMGADTGRLVYNDDILILIENFRYQSTLGMFFLSVFGEAYCQYIPFLQNHVNPGFYPVYGYPVRSELQGGNLMCA